MQMPRQNQDCEQERTDQSASRTEDYEECLRRYADLFLDHPHEGLPRPHFFIDYRLVHVLAPAIVSAQDIQSLPGPFECGIEPHVLQSSHMHIIADPWHL